MSECGDCKFFKTLPLQGMGPFRPDMGGGNCVRFPPTVHVTPVDEGKKIQFSNDIPWVLKDFWCGEFKEKDQDNAQR